MKAQAQDRLLIFGLSLLLVLCCVALAPAQEKGDEGVAPAALTGDNLGIMTGGIYLDGPQPLSQYADPILYEFRNGMGTKYVRLELNWGGRDNSDVVAKTTEMAHKLGMQVIVVYQSPDHPDVDDTDGLAIQQRIINPYIADLNRIIPAVFKTNASRPDAFETGNEYNQCVRGPCNESFGFRVGGNATAWLARRVKERFQDPAFMRGRWAGVKVLSAGSINTYVNEEPVWWNAFLNSNAWCRSGNCANHDNYLPFDRVAVHPYNPAGRDLQCINAGRLDCWNGWLTYTQGSLANLRSRVTTASGGNARALYATEYHWQFPPEGPGSNNACTPSNMTRCCRDGMLNCVKTEDQMRQVMGLAIQAFGDPTQVEAAIWADYRSGDNANSGVRQRDFDWGNFRYPAWDATWYRMRSLAGGSGNPNDMWPGQNWARRFTDLDQNSQYSPEVEWLNRDFIVHGRPDGRYDTWANITRREFSIFLTRALARYRFWVIDNPPTSPFSDVPATDADFQYIVTLYNHGVIGGYDDGTFRPGNPLLRSQAAKMFQLSNGWGNENPQPQCQFTDVRPSDYFYYQVSTVCNHGLFSGYADRTFRPFNPIIRGQMAAVLYRNFHGTKELDDSFEPEPPYDPTPAPSDEQPAF